ncbi:hypothetical protein [Leekyejoonella antrihumi]|uniref:Uncharacterized protein n=1 Tax=Leekyejoonella antrihumi TaxID=1660198 RepID=A0A563EAX5_9MICO|nr:hypothetical protein [Leekyejoonella antrihumi]TWP38944.1 hypothetical protein FGL98_00655 [Leekyejoonella antrihumi]
MAAATALLDRDAGIGLVDTDRLLEVSSWLGQAAFSHAKTDRSHRDKAGLLDQLQATQAVVNTISAVQHVRVGRYVATTETLDLDLGATPGTISDTTPGAGRDADGPDGAGPRECAHELGQVGEFADVDLAPVMLGADAGHPPHGGGRRRGDQDTPAPGCDGRCWMRWAPGGSTRPGSRR